MLALLPEYDHGDDEKEPHDSEPELPPPENEASEEKLPEGVIDKRKFFRDITADNKLRGLDELFGYHLDEDDDE